MDISLKYYVLMIVFYGISLIYTFIRIFYLEKESTFFRI